MHIRRDVLAHPSHAIIYDATEPLLAFVLGLVFSGIQNKKTCKLRDASEKEGLKKTLMSLKMGKARSLCRQYGVCCVMKAFVSEETQFIYSDLQASSLGHLLGVINLIFKRSLGQSSELHPSTQWMHLWIGPRFQDEPKALPLSFQLSHHHPQSRPMIYYDLVCPFTS